MDPKVRKLVNLAQNWAVRPLIRPIINLRPKISKKSHKLLLPENVSISAFYTVILDEMDPKMAKLVNLAQNWTFTPLIRPIIHQRVMLEGPESPHSPYKLLLPENVSINAF